VNGEPRFGGIRCCKRSCLRDIGRPHQNPWKFQKSLEVTVIKIAFVLSRHCPYVLNQELERSSCVRMMPKQVQEWPRYGKDYPTLKVLKAFPECGDDPDCPLICDVTLDRNAFTGIRLPLKGKHARVLACSPITPRSRTDVASLLSLHYSTSLITRRPRCTFGLWVPLSTYNTSD
jgi:hypothetical protein